MNLNIQDYKETEADVAAEFYHRCKGLGLVAKMEVKLPSDVHRSGFMRADALVFQIGKVVCAVEFKGCRRSKMPLNPKSRQYRAYAGLSIPFFLCSGSDEIEDTLDDVCALADKLI
ncbi:hypothetical protein LCGC14_3129170 [marine sediment metagenome]|uniref:VRR-NUC domain-containing protein n=1 Tax=marine sediment metagenome TaxID=412755 RepID=A0A0F8W097_9ZZZZ